MDTCQPDHNDIIDTAPPLGLYEKALPTDSSWDGKLTTTGQAGFDFLEISIDESDQRIARLDWPRPQRQELAAQAIDHNVPIRSLALSAHRRFPLGSPDHDTRSTALSIMEQSIDFSLDMGIRIILLSGCDVYYEESTPRTKDLLLRSLETAVNWAEQAQVMLALENWDRPIDSLTEVMQYVDHFKSPWFQAYADIGNLTCAGKDIPFELEAARGHIAAVHVKDTRPGDLRYVAPGEGSVPFREAFRKLIDIKYRGSMVLELWTGDRPDALHQIASGRSRILQHYRLAADTQRAASTRE